MKNRITEILITVALLLLAALLAFQQVQIHSERARANRLATRIWRLRLYVLEQAGVPRRPLSDFTMVSPPGQN